MRTQTKRNKNSVMVIIQKSIRSFSALLLALVVNEASFASVDAVAIAKAHLLQHGSGLNPLKIDQETKQSILVLEEFVINTDEEICHRGVIVEKATGKITLGEDDPDLVLQFSYSDTFVDHQTKIFEFCAD